MNFRLALVFASFLVSSVASADHTLADAMKMNPKIGAAVRALAVAAKMTCDLDSSYQDYYPGYPASTAFLQTAKCYRQHGSEDAGTLKVGYQWLIKGTTARPTQLISLEFTPPAAD